LDSTGAPSLSSELIAALEEPPVRPGRKLFRLMLADGLFAPVALVVALAIAAGGLVIEAILFRGIIDLSS
jgi:ATP-binding cassette subfamily B protein